LTNSDSAPPPFIDVDGNRIVEALDVLIVINYINAQLSGGQGEGEGSVAAATFLPNFWEIEDGVAKNRRRRLS
jgi:hypothetical protein